MLTVCCCCKNEEEASDGAPAVIILCKCASPFYFCICNLENEGGVCDIAPDDNGSISVFSKMKERCE